MRAFPLQRQNLVHARLQLFTFVEANTPERESRFEICAKFYVASYVGLILDVACLITAESGKKYIRTYKKGFLAVIRYGIL